LVFASFADEGRVFAKVDPYAVVVADGLAVEGLAHVYRCFCGGVGDNDPAEGAEGREGVEGDGLREEFSYFGEGGGVEVGG